MSLNDRQRKKFQSLVALQDIDDLRYNVAHADSLIANMEEDLERNKEMYWLMRMEIDRRESDNPDRDV